MRNLHRKRIKIGLLVTSVEFGGLEKVVMGLVDHVDTDEYEVVPIVFIAQRQERNAFVKYVERSGNTFFEIIVDKERVKYMNPVVNFRQVVGLLKNLKVDLVHTHGYRADVLGYMGASLLGIPILATCHGFIQTGRKLAMYNRLDKFVLRKFNRVIAVSDTIGASLADAGVKTEKISIIPNAVGLNCRNRSDEQVRQEKRASLGWGDEHFVLGYVGRLSEEKGLEYLFDAVSYLADSNIPVRLVIIGDGAQKVDLERKAREKGIDASLVFLGFQNDVQSWLPAFDAFVLPSMMEGTPMAMLEAMLFKLPVVASRVGGVPEVIRSGENGILVPPGDAIKIADAVKMLFDSEFRHTIGINAFKTVQSKYGIKDWIKKIEVEYRMVAAYQ